VPGKREEAILVIWKTDIIAKSGKWEENKFFIRGAI